ARRGRGAAVEQGEALRKVQGLSSPPQGTSPLPEPPAAPGQGHASQAGVRGAPRGADAARGPRGVAAGARGGARAAGRAGSEAGGGAPAGAGPRAGWAGLGRRYKTGRPCPRPRAEAGAPARTGGAGLRWQLAPRGGRRRREGARPATRVPAASDHAAPRQTPPRPRGARLLPRAHPRAHPRVLHPAAAAPALRARVSASRRRPAPALRRGARPVAAGSRRCGRTHGLGPALAGRALAAAPAPRPHRLRLLRAARESAHAPQGVALPRRPRRRPAPAPAPAPGAAPAAAAAPALPARPRPRPRPAPRAPAPPARARRLLRAPEGLLSRALRARGSRGLARARSACGGDRDEPPSRAGAPSASASASPSPSPSPPPSPPPPPGPDPRPERLEAEGTVALGRAGGALRLAAEYSRASGRLRVRLLGAEGRAAAGGRGGGGGAAGAAEPRAVGCRVSFVLRPPGQTRPRRSAVVRPSRAAASEQDVWLDGLSEEQLRRLAVRVQAEERGRLRGQGELLLGALLLPAGPGLRPPPRA
uniref:Uncharacterized protein n=1 Tax=Canis lupus familiaris TaxID=9615 RepID=A0A8C0TAR6_CANLF